MEKSYKYLPYFFLLLMPITLAAFFPTYLIQFPQFSERNNVFTHLHSIVSAVWLVLLLTQPFLIRNRQFELHAKLGTLSYFVFPLLVLSFIPQTLKAAHDHFVTIFFPLADAAVMIGLYALAIYYRKDSAKHMRYMIAMTLVFLFPTLGRINPIWLNIRGTISQDLNYGIIYLILLALIFHDKRSQKNFKPYLLAIPFFLAHQVIFHFLF